ncbi:hypothetical protein NCS13_1_0325 [Neochlamydia sp. S13]|nr:hypothetical protein NCS13_1_0325 [Neochlamydia sp. S13]
MDYPIEYKLGFKVFLKERLKDKDFKEGIKDIIKNTPFLSFTLSRACLGFNPPNELAACRRANYQANA